MFDGLALCIPQVAELQLSDTEENGLSWNSGFSIGSIVEGKVHEIKEFGVVISFENYSNVYGFISHYQCKSSYETSSESDFSLES